MHLIWLRLKTLYYKYRFRPKDLPTQIRDNLQVLTRLDLKKSILETDFVVFDKETTGLHVRKGDSIVSMSAVRIKNGRIALADVFPELINPKLRVV
jgi:DNA polymerase III alpha subunit (gram-positive type)